MSSTGARAQRRVVVVGAGFAGLTAARELEGAGVEVEVFEARDRIGGRAWTDERLGRTLEMGATWVHWMQPFIWTEIRRYGQGIHPSPDVEQALWLSEGTVHTGTEAELDAKIARVQAKIFEGSDEFFPYPHDPFAVLRDENTPKELRDRFLAADNGSVLDALRDGEFSQEEIDLADSYWAGGYQGSTATGSPLMAKHWASLADHRSALLDQLTLKFKLDNGMRGVYEGIAGDVRAEIELSSPVAAVEHDGNGVTVVLEDGRRVSADAVIVTVPLGAMKNVDFSPPLTQRQRKLMADGSNSRGFKIWIKVAGRHSIIAGANGDNPISLLRSEYFTDDGNTVLVGFGSDHDAIELSDTASAQKAIDVWCGGLEVLESGGHDWVADKWSGQTWATLRSGQFFNGWSAFRESDSRVKFASADWASGWNGVCVDGAIEMGITSARELIEEFRA